MAAFSSLSGLLVKAIGLGGSKAFKNILTSAGVGLVSSQIILTVVNNLIDMAVAQFGLISVAGLLGLAGVDVGMSIIIGAMVARATLVSQTVSFKSITK